MKNTIQYFTMFLFVSIILMGSAMAADEDPAKGEKKEQ